MSFGRRLAGDRCRGDDKICGLDVLGEHGVDLVYFLGGQLARVAAFAACIDPGSTKVAPRESACSCVSGRTS